MTGKKIILLVIVVGLMFTTALICGNLFAKHKIKYFLENRLPSNVTNNYSAITVDVLHGSVSILNSEVQIKNKKDSLNHTLVKTEKLIINDLSYFNYFFNGAINIKNIEITKPIITHFSDILKESNNEKTDLAKLYKVFRIDELKINQAEVTVLNKSRDSITLKAKDLNLEIDNVRIDSKTIKKNIPLEFTKYTASGGHLFLKSSNFENIELKSFKIENNHALFTTISLMTKNSKTRLSKILKKERDHYNITIPTIEIENLDFGFKNEELFINSKAINVKNPVIEIFRDKMVTDDLSIKPFYNAMIRSIPFDILINKTKIENAKITYTEKVKSENNGGKISFTNMDIALSKFTKNKALNIDVEGIFMENTPIKVNWIVNTKDESDSFTFKGELGRLPAEQMNNFTIPNLNIKLLGTTDKIYFDINGNKFLSKVNMRTKYRKFEVVLLNSKSKKKNRFLSGIASLFIKKTSKTDEGKFKNISTEVKPDRTKSFFNYLWLNLRAGLLETLTVK